MADTPETLDESLATDVRPFAEAVETALEADAKPIPEPQPKEEATVEEFTTQTGLAAALLAIQAAMPAIEKNAVNPHFKSRYTTTDHLFSKALPVCRKHGVLVTQWPTTIGGVGALCTRLTHVPTGETWEDVMPLAMVKEGPQEQASCLTYAKRLALGAALCVSTEEDDDANAATLKPASKAKPAAAKVETAPTELIDELKGLLTQLDGRPGWTEAGVVKGAARTFRPTIKTLADLTADEAGQIIKAAGVELAS